MLLRPEPRSTATPTPNRSRELPWARGTCRTHGAQLWHERQIRHVIDRDVSLHATDLDNRKIGAHTFLMRRKPGTLVPLEAEILTIAVLRAATDRPDFHGFELAKLVAEEGRSGKLLANGTLYKALNRLADSGMLTADWEDAAIALTEGRPRRRLYRITVRGEHAAASAAISGTRQQTAVRQLGLEPT